MADAATPVTRHLHDASWDQIAVWLAGTDIEYAEISGPGWQVWMLRETGYLPQQGWEANPANARAQSVTVAATVAGIFLDRHPLRSAPLAMSGARVRQGDTVGLLQLGAVLAPVVAPADGIVTSVLARPGELVGYGTALVQIDAVDNAGSGTGETPWK